MLRIEECRETGMCYVYTVVRYHSSAIGHVLYSPSCVKFRYYCQRIESIGLACSHILVVLILLDFNELPSCLILDRWTKNVKEVIRGKYLESSTYWDFHLLTKYARLVEVSGQVVTMLIVTMTSTLFCYNYSLGSLVGWSWRINLQM